MALLTLICGDLEKVMSQKPVLDGGHLYVFAVFCRGFLKPLYIANTAQEYASYPDLLMVVKLLPSYIGGIISQAMK